MLEPAVSHICPCRPDCTAPVRGHRSTYAQGHDLRAAARLCAGMGLTPVAAATLLKDRYGSVGAADRMTPGGVIPR